MTQINFDIAHDKSIIRAMNPDENAKYIRSWKYEVILNEPNNSYQASFYTDNQKRHTTRIFQDGNFSVLEQQSDHIFLSPILISDEEFKILKDGISLHKHDFSYEGLTYQHSYDSIPNILSEIYAKPVKIYNSNENYLKLLEDRRTLNNLGENYNKNDTKIEFNFYEDVNKKTQIKSAKLETFVYDIINANNLESGIENIEKFSFEVSQPADKNFVLELTIDGKKLNPVKITEFEFYTLAESISLSAYSNISHNLAGCNSRDVLKKTNSIALEKDINTSNTQNHFSYAHFGFFYNIKNLYEKPYLELASNEVTKPSNYVTTSGKANLSPSIMRD